MLSAVHSSSALLVLGFGAVLESSCPGQGCYAWGKGLTTEQALLPGLDWGEFFEEIL